MALTFTKKSAAPAAKPALGKPAATMGFLKTGAAAKAALAAEEARVAEAKAAAGKLYRFRLKEGEARTITFLDGYLDADGLLDIPMWMEHTLQVNGNWTNVVCTQEQEPCPVCATGDRPSLVGGLTVIDHTEFTIQKGANAGKVISNQKRLFVAKRGTLKILQKLAEKRGGLAGCTFEVSRTSDKSPSVGDMFDFSQQDSLEELREHFGQDDEGNWIATPANYDEEVVYRTADQLIELGIGKAVASIGAKKGFDKKALSEAI